MIFVESVIVLGLTSHSKEDEDGMEVRDLAQVSRRRTWWKRF